MNETDSSKHIKNVHNNNVTARQHQTSNDAIYFSAP